MKIIKDIPLKLLGNVPPFNLAENSQNVGNIIGNNFVMGQTLVGHLDLWRSNYGPRFCVKETRRNEEGRGAFCKAFSLFLALWEFFFALSNSSNQINNEF
jgi:hypothetical protein